MSLLSTKIDEVCNSFSEESENVCGLVNISTEKLAANDTAEYLLNTLNRGKQARETFYLKWKERPEHFHAKMKQT